VRFDRRRGLALALWTATGLAGVLGPSRVALAGAQREEPLADAVRTALSAAVANSAPPRPVFASFEQRQGYEHWMSSCSRRLQKRKPDPLVREEFLQTVWYEATRAGLDPTLVIVL